MNRRTFFRAIGFTGLAAMIRRDTAAIATAQSSTILEAGEYFSSIVVSDDDVIIEGAGTPVFNGDDLVGGTVIKGQIDVNNKKRVIIRNLGVDVRGLGLDAIDSGTQTFGTRQELIVENVVCLGDGINHGITLTSGSHNLVRNVRIFNFQHGVVFRCSHSRLDGAYLENIGIWSVGIKGAAATGDADYCSVTGVISSGPGMIAIKAEAGHMANFAHVHDCHLIGGQARAVNILADAGGVADHAIVQQVTSVDSLATAGDFVTNGVSAAMFIGCQAVNPGAFGFYRVNGGDVQLVGCRGTVYGF